MVVLQPRRVGGAAGGRCGSTTVSGRTLRQRTACAPHICSATAARYAVHIRGGFGLLAAVVGNCLARKLQASHSKRT